VTSKLKCKINSKEFSLSDVWCDEEDKLSPDEILELIKEDISAFIDDLGGIDEFTNLFEFYWR
jgi:hypothetical protein